MAKLHPDTVRLLRRYHNHGYSVVSLARGFWVESVLRTWCCLRQDPPQYHTGRCAPASQLRSSATRWRVYPKATDRSPSPRR